MIKRLLLLLLLLTAVPAWAQFTTVVTDSMQLRCTTTATPVPGRYVLACDNADNTFTIMAPPGTGGTLITMTPDTLTNLGAPADNTVAICSNCAPYTTPCTATGTGAMALRLNGAWTCGTGTTAVPATAANPFLGAAQCNAGVASPLFDTMTANPAVAVCEEGSNTVQGALAYADGATALSAQISFALPGNYTGGSVVRIFWSTSAITGSVVWQVSSACVAVGEDNNATWNAASVIADVADGTPGRMNTATISPLTISGVSACAAGEFMHLKVVRDPTHAGDNLAATANFYGMSITIPKQ